ncbi:hypothetical protein GUITHDRAFT_99112 [Guillardia theta CCMP2712]|uniref:Uncharacterized protein n=1 Tax=Guillardia theta (strain CCMP2712) TaxID=905079 RepID=L1K4R6_GUITC|nr:hypothetical protein GUITHDRAFT_99112 [Guillardia theta CCMP2712]EKX55333.1 hypothetical protein GUITHDRAFT_99112 [Guillardia theta CCMP2712]|eukprot:XP_005842313.1 hypothetical protein GUITHDRAFT_99112 [Guillardia theta CCMP2712]
MPRPRASTENQLLALEFAQMVTTKEGASSRSFIARHGASGPFGALSRCVPAVVRRGGEYTANRKAISEAEMLRALEKSGSFERFRNRKAVRISEDPTGAGMCMFRGRRWRNPDVAADLAALEEGHRRLQERHAAYSLCCKWDVLIDTLRSINAEWSKRWTEMNQNDGVQEFSAISSSMADLKNLVHNTSLPNVSQCLLPPMKIPHEQDSESKKHLQNTDSVPKDQNPSSEVQCVQDKCDSFTSHIARHSSISDEDQSKTSILTLCRLAEIFLPSS